MKRVVGIGAGGHAKVVLEILLNDPDYEFVGMLDRNKELWSKPFFGVSVLGGDALLEELFKQGIRHAFIGVGTTGDTKPRQHLYHFAASIGCQFVSAIHPRAIVSPSAQIGQGVAITAGAIINSGAHIGNNVIINTGSVIEHDCVIGDHAHIATSAALAGGVTVGQGSHVGIGACVRQGVRIGRNAIVGAGAVVVNDVADEEVVAGNPARILKKDGP
jgi:sugar O-acyltransferase (sialic acid O-acetyltransferase NeuD family)